jgi:hypothetical protein
MESSGGDKPTATDATESVLDKDHSERSVTSATITVIRQPPGVLRISALRVGVEYKTISSWLARSNQASWTSGAGLIYKKSSLLPLNFWCSSSLDFMRDPVQEAVTTLLASLSKHR